MQLAGDFLAHIKEERFGTRITVKQLLERGMYASETIPPVSRTLICWSFRVKGKDAEGREQELGQVPIAKMTILPEALAALDDSLQNELDRAECHLPAHEEA